MMKTTKQEYLNELKTVLKLQEGSMPVEINSVPDLFRDDFNRFFMGETLQLINGQIVISKKKYREWITKIKTQGLNYVIQLENS